jgi:hypothetical protein
MLEKLLIHPILQDPGEERVSDYSSLWNKWLWQINTVRFTGAITFRTYTLL